MSKRETPCVVYCDDWACPARASCARAWGRAREYWRFRPDLDDREGVALRKMGRAAGEDACDEYERDEVRPWMVEAYAPPPSRDGGWRMPQFVRWGTEIGF